MPPRKSADETPEPAAPEPEGRLVPFNVILGGQDRTVFAKDEADLEHRLALIRGLI